MFRAPRRTLSWHRQIGAPVDTHILLYHSLRRPAWLDQCLSSLEREPTNILLVNDQGRNVGAARAAAMAQGAAPLLCFVDDDDYVEPGSYDACIAALRDSSLCGAYTRFRTIDASTSSPLKISAATPWSRAAQASYVFEVMHLHVFRRAAAEPHFREIAQWDTGEEALLMGLMTKSGGWLKIDRVGYTKRNHGAGAGSRISGKMVKQLQYRLRPILLPTHRPSILRPTGCRRCDGARQIGSAALKKLGR